MTTIQLKDSDTSRMRALNAKNGYGLDSGMVKRLINRHKAGNDYQRALIEYRLTDVNFHRGVEMLEAGKYDELRKEVEQW